MWDGVATLDVGFGAHVYSYLPYHIDFVGGIGKLVFQSPANGNGAAQITPTEPTLDGSTCTHELMITGSFAGAF
jgi:hypothetical protein